MKNSPLKHSIPVDLEKFVLFRHVAGEMNFLQNRLLMNRAWSLGSLLFSRENFSNLVNGLFAVI